MSKISIVDKPRLSKFSQHFFLLLLLALPFQNCGVRPAKSTDKIPNKGLYYGGNGEGYTGKLSGMYASLDTLNQCGGNAGDMYKVKDEIKVVDNKLFYMVRNCVPLATPEPIADPKLAAIESSGGKFVLGQQMFQKGGFVDSDQAYSHEFADFFCSGVDDTDPAPGVKRITELTVFMGWRSLVNVPGVFDQSLRAGYLRVIDFSPLENRILNNNVYAFDPLMQTFVTDAASGTRVISIYNTDGGHEMNMTFVEVDAMSPFTPSVINYSISGGPLRSALPITCYRTY